MTQAPTGQYASVDEDLTAIENLVLFGRLQGMSGRQARARGDQLLADFALTEAAQRQLKKFSGGMRRRLDLAVSLIAWPPLIFLDEPTTGLDPRTRGEMWATIRAKVTAGATVLQPIVFTLMFTFIFGGAIAGDVKAYLPTFIPGILVTTVITTSMVTGTQIREDMDKGVFDRFKALPMARIAPLAGGAKALVPPRACGRGLGFEADWRGVWALCELRFDR